MRFFMHVLSKIKDIAAKADTPRRQQAQANRLSKHKNWTSFSSEKLR